MSVWLDLLNALPTGASEALASIGLTQLLQRLRRDLGVTNPVVRDLEAVERDEPVDLSRLVSTLSAIHLEAGNLVAYAAGENASAQQIGSNTGLVIQNLSVANPTLPSED